jgi:hypothetical protein
MVSLLQHHFLFRTAAYTLFQLLRWLRCLGDTRRNHCPRCPASVSCQLLHGSSRWLLGVSLLCEHSKSGKSGELPITLTRPDRSVIQQQKTPFSIFGLTFYRPVLERFYRHPTPLSIQFFYSPTMERTFVELFDCSIWPDRLTGSSPVERSFPILLYSIMNFVLTILDGRNLHWLVPFLSCCLQF